MPNCGPLLDEYRESHSHPVNIAVHWVALLIGHKIEGRVPSDFQNPHLISIGPAWIMRRVFHTLGLKDT